MSDVQTAADMFGVGAVSHAHSRYALDAGAVPSLAGGRVGTGRASGTDDTPLLVHTAIPGRKEQAIDLGAVASAITAGVIPLPLLVKSFKDAGSLDALKAEIAKVK